MTDIIEAFVSDVSPKKNRGVKRKLVDYENDDETDEKKDEMETTEEGEKEMARDEKKSANLEDDEGMLCQHPIWSVRWYFW